MSQSEQSPLEDLLRKALAPGAANYPPPPLSSMKARKYVSGSSERPESDDLFSLVASFLNMRIKLYHAVVAFLIIWAAILLYGGEETTRASEPATIPYAANVGAAYNSTVPACIKTYAIKK
jgi:hypothetical protein